MTKQDDLFEYMFRTWKVPVSKHKRVRWQGHPADIVKALSRDRLKLKFLYPQDKPFDKFEYHPLVDLDYGDGIDYAARNPDDYAAFRREQGLPV